MAPGEDAEARRSGRGRRGRRSGRGPHRTADDLRRGTGRGGLHRLGIPGAQRAAQPAPGDPGAGPGGGGRARLRAGRGGAGAERAAQGGRRRDRAPAVAGGRVRGPVGGRGGQPAVPRPDQPRYRGGGATARLRPADQVGGHRRARRRRPDPGAGPQERRADPARPGARAGPDGPAVPAAAHRHARRLRDPDHRERARRQQVGHARAGPPPAARPWLPDPGLPARLRRQPGQHRAAGGPHRGGRRSRGGPGVRAGVAGLLLRLGRRPGDQPPAGAGPRGCRARSCARTTRRRSVSCPRCASTASTFPARWR